MEEEVLEAVEIAENGAGTLGEVGGAALEKQFTGAAVFAVQRASVSGNAVRTLLLRLGVVTRESVDRAVLIHIHRRVGRKVADHLQRKLPTREKLEGGSGGLISCIGDKKPVLCGPDTVFQNVFL